jgi:energy-coupling factor transport system substrate-specific component
MENNVQAESSIKEQAAVPDSQPMNEPVTKKPYWDTRDFVFAAMVSAGLLVVASVIIPLTLPLRIPGLTNAVNGLFGSFLIVIGLARLRKPGSLILITGVYALICLMISPIIFGFILFGGLVGEIICTLVFKGYRGKAAPVAGAVLYEMGMFPAAMALSFFFLPERYSNIAWWVFIVAEIAIFTTSLIGGLLGLKVAKELAKAGKLRLED